MQQPFAIAIISGLTVELPLVQLPLPAPLGLLVETGTTCAAELARVHRVAVRFRH
jgi:hypothetical protein